MGMLGPRVCTWTRGGICGHRSSRRPGRLGWTRRPRSSPWCLQACRWSTSSRRGDQRNGRCKDGSGARMWRWIWRGSVGDGQRSPTPSASGGSRGIRIRSLAAREQVWRRYLDADADAPDYVIGDLLQLVGAWCSQQALEAIHGRTKAGPDWPRAMGAKLGRSSRRPDVHRWG